MTAHEGNVIGYEIEKSTDGIHFNSIGSVAANVNLGNTYTFRDKNVFNTSCYYRITVIEKSGNKTYSSIVLVKAENNNGLFILFPNPVIGKTIHIQLKNVVKDNYQVRVYNGIGKLTMEHKIWHTGGSEAFSFTIPSLMKGFYRIIISNKQGNVAEKDLIVD